jgi:hypothetical protein
VAACVVLACAVFACSSDGDSLLGGGAGGGGGGGPGGPGPLGDVDASSPIQIAQRAQDLFRKLEPDLTKLCGGSCHVGGTIGNAPRWLAPPDAYVSIKAYPGIITPDPDASELLTKGPHAGPALTGDLATRVRDWLSVEATLLTKAVLPTTDPFDVVMGRIRST